MGELGETDLKQERLVVLLLLSRLRVLPSRRGFLCLRLSRLIRLS